MKQILFLLIIANLTFLNAMTKKADKDALDDWEYNRTAVMKDSSRQMTGMGSPMIKAMPVPKSMAIRSKKIGMAVGGAKDSNNFKANIERGYLPKLDSITYEGQFYQHYFDTGLGEQTCNALFCPSYSSAKRFNTFSDEQEYFLSVGLNSGIDEKDFKRKKLNLVVVLDISGSMGANFDEYYYDKLGNKIDSNEKNPKKKMSIACDSIVSMLSHLKDDDRVGIVLFDHNAYRAKPLRLVGKTDKKAIRDHILKLEERGGTNWSAGYKEGLSLFDDIETMKDSAYENRIVFLTDAMPNMGELGKDRLFGMAKEASAKGIHTTFIGVGVDFNNDLVEYVSKTKGANYFSVHSSKEFAKVMDKEFDYMVTPLVYDLEMKLSSKNYKIEAVYGSPDAKIATGEIMKINTLFPSSNNGEATKGGIVILKLKRINARMNDPFNLKVSYTDVNGKKFTNSQDVKFKGSKSYYDNSGIRKGILISDYVSVMKNWLIDSRAGCNDKVDWVMKDPVAIMKRSMSYPPKHPLYPLVATWERKSCKLNVSSGYKKLFYVFKKHYIKEMNELNDGSLSQELNIINSLLKESTSTSTSNPKDDWEYHR